MNRIIKLFFILFETLCVNCFLRQKKYMKVELMKKYLKMY